MSRQADVMLRIMVDWQPFINAMQELSDAVAERARNREFERRYARQRSRKARRVRQGR